MIPLPRFLSSLRIRLGVTFFLLLSLAVAFVITVMTLHTADTQLEAMKRLRQSLGDSVIPNVQRMASANDFKNLYGFAQKLTRDPGIAAIRIIDDENIILFEHSNPQLPLNWLTEFLATEILQERKISADLIFADEAHGVIEASLSLNPLNNAINDLLFLSSILVSGMLLITAVLLYRLRGKLSKPLKALTCLADEIARGRRAPNTQLIDSPYYEISALNQAFNNSAATMWHNISRLEETRELLDHSEGRLHKLINGMHEVLFELDVEGHITFLNPAWQRMTGLTIEECIGRSLSSYLIEDTPDSLFKPENLGRLQERNRHIRLRTLDNSRLWANLEADSQYDHSGNFTGIIGTLSDITKTLGLNKLLKRYQDDLYHMSVTDPLTGLYNRRHFDNQLEIILNEHLPSKQSICLMLIDVDGFKFINDTYGHPFGDEVLKTISNLLKKLVRRNDYIARLAGDEFAMVLKNTNLEHATNIAEKLHANINGTYIDLPVGRLQLLTSIGVAEAPTHGNNAQELVSAADVALYHSKQRGRNRIEVLSPDISKAVMSIFNQGFQLRHALEHGNINPAFQPICNMQSGKPMAYEVLARMRHQDSIIQAKDFIVLAEELGLTRDVDLHIIKQALALAPKNQGLFLNVDLSSFNDRKFVKELRKLLKPACEAGQKITLEITERETVPITETLQEDIKSLRALGCKLALDDFGSGYSTYNFLNLFRPDYIKIEGAFVRGMLDNEANHKIVVHIHELATSFGMETIAESVENIETLKALKKIGVRTAQGLHFGAPEMMN